MSKRLAGALIVVGAWMLVGSAAYAQTTTSTTAPASVERSSETTTTLATTTATQTANTGPNDYLYFVGAGGLIALGSGMQMRGRRAAGAHWR